MKDPDVPSLIQGLRDGGDRREAAIARLTIAGKRAVARLVEAYQDTTDRDVQIAILRVLEATGDERALGAAATAIAAHGDVAVAGVAVLRELMGRPQGGVDVKALDVLLAIARDPSVERRVRAAAVSALEERARPTFGRRLAASRRATLRCPPANLSMTRSGKTP